MSAVKAASSSAVRATLRCVERCCPSTRQAVRPAWSPHARRSFDDGRGSPVSRRVRQAYAACSHGPASPLRISFSSVRSATALRRLGDTDGPDGIGHRRTLARRHLDLPQLRHDLLRAMPLPAWHRMVLLLGQSRHVGWTTSREAGHPARRPRGGREPGGDISAENTVHIWQTFPARISSLSMPRTWSRAASIIRYEGVCFSIPNRQLGVRNGASGRRAV